MRKEPAEDRFWAKVDKSGDCWLWTGSLKPNGYGAILADGKMMQAPRYSWQLHYGVDPGNRVVRRHCGQMACVKPTHLYLDGLVFGTLAERFHTHYVKDPHTECWLWTGSIIKGGYGMIGGGEGKNLMAHRVSWELYHGPIPDGLIVCHHCDVPSCVNPEHLFVGTYQDNSDDSVAKGHSARGQRNPNHVFKNAEVRVIRALWANGDISQSELARRYGVSSPTICNIVNGKTWSWLPQSS